METTNSYFMNEAYKEAQIAFEKDEVPVGAIIVKENKIIGRGHNIRNEVNNSIWHAEMVAINDACKKLNSWYLVDCDLYVTLEPCPMCAGACVQSRIKNVFFGAYDPKGGSVVSVAQIFDIKKYNHHPNYCGGLLEEKCSKLISDYFKLKR